MKRKPRVSFLTAPQEHALKLACAPIAMVGRGTFHVGSSLYRPDYHDVDLRCIVSDSLYGSPACCNVLFLNAVISRWLSQASGLPIDFQFQSDTAAKKFSGRRNGVIVAGNGEAQ